MAVTQDTRDTSTDTAPKPGPAPSGGQDQARGRTITVPSVQSMLPLSDAFEPKHLLWFGGLATAGAIGILEWPVVAAVGVGTYVAERFARTHHN